MNHLLAGDYDEQGYVTYLGLHTFNYIKQDGVYYFCDFLCYINDGAYLLYACEDPHDFAEYYYTTVFPAEWNDPSDPNYLVYMYLYPRDGQNDLCIGYRDGLDNTYFNLVPAEVRDTLIPLYVRDGVQPLEFIDFDSSGGAPGRYWRTDAKRERPMGVLFLLIARSTVPGRCGRRTAPPPSYCGRYPGQALCRSASPGR